MRLQGSSKESKKIDVFSSRQLFDFCKKLGCFHQFWGLLRNTLLIVAALLTSSVLIFFLGGDDNNTNPKNKTGAFFAKLHCQGKQRSPHLWPILVTGELLSPIPGVENDPLQMAFSWLINGGLLSTY